MPTLTLAPTRVFTLVYTNFTFASRIDPTLDDHLAFAFISTLANACAAILTFTILLSVLLHQQIAHTLMSGSAPAQKASLQ